MGDQLHAHDEDHDRSQVLEHRWVDSEPCQGQPKIQISGETSDENAKNWRGGLKGPLTTFPPHQRKVLLTHRDRIKARCKEGTIVASSVASAIVGEAIFNCLRKNGLRRRSLRGDSTRCATATSRRSAPEMPDAPVAQESIAPTNCLGGRIPEDERGQTGRQRAEVAANHAVE